MAAVTTNPTNTSTEFVELPPAGSLNEMWVKLGMGIVNDHDPAIERFEPTGLYRRLNAGVKSILARGTAQEEFHLGSQDGSGFTQFVWESRGGVWTPRHWRVTGKVRPFGRSMLVIESTVAVESSAKRGEWTVFYGGPLNAVLSDRLNFVFAHFGARALKKGELAGWTPAELTEAEAEAHDEQYTQYSAWVLRLNKWSNEPGTRVVFIDDDWGSGYLTIEAKGQDTLAGVCNTLGRFWFEQVDCWLELDMSPTGTSS